MPVGTMRGASPGTGLESQLWQRRRISMLRHQRDARPWACRIIELDILDKKFIYISKEIVYHVVSRNSESSHAVPSDRMMML
jgi:hypothetical protein